MHNTVTTDLSEFGRKELEEASELLKTWAEDGLPSTFYEEGITLNMSENSGYCFS